jgi:hypothetical protein
MPELVLVLVLVLVELLEDEDDAVDDVAPPCPPAEVIPPEPVAPPLPTTSPLEAQPMRGRSRPTVEARKITRRIGA